MKIFGVYFYQLIVTILSLFMIYQGLSRFIKKELGQTFLKLFVRIIIWGGMIIVVMFPKISYQLAEAIGIVGNINAVIITGFILVFLMIFKMLSSVERLEQQITKLARKESLKDIDKK